MAEQTVALAPSDSKLVSFEAIPHEARIYQVAVDELRGTFEARPLPTSTLEGGVTDAETGWYIQRVLVTINGLSIYTKLTYHGIYGGYGFEGLEPGEYTISCERLGYEPLTVTKTISAGDNRLDIAMTRLPPERLPIQIIDFDINNNGIVDGEDEAAFLAAYGSKEGDPNYDRRFDANFDGVIDGWDYDTFYRTLGKNLDIIRDNIKTGVYEHLVWTDGWDASLVALNKDMVQEFTGATGKEGWISIQHHPYYPIVEGYHYICQNFAMDTGVAAYRALGYGCLLLGWSWLHGYNIFWVGGNWHDLNNWYILEPQNGKIFNAAQPGLPLMYETLSIRFPDTSCQFVFPPTIYSEGLSPGVMFSPLNVDYETKTVDYAPLGPELYHRRYGGCTSGFAYNEEPIPTLFDRAYLVGA